MNKILIGIPTYNCSKQIVRVLKDLTLDSNLRDKYNPHFLIVDNCSTDNTISAVRECLRASEFHIKIEIIQNIRNLGLGGTQKKFFEYASLNGYEKLIVLHGDHQANPFEISKFLDEMSKSPSCDVLLGSRFMFSSKRTGYDRIRVLGNLGLNLIYSFFCGRIIWDLGSGLNIFKTSIYAKNSFSNFSDGMTFNMDLLLFLVSNDIKFKFFPMEWRESDQVSNARNLQVGWAALKALFQWKLQRLKVRI